MAETLQSPSRYRGQKATKNIAAQNTWCDPVYLHGPFNFSLSGTWSGAVTIQRSFDAGATWHDVATYSANIETAGDEPESGVRYRAGIKTGDYTSGTAVVRLSQ